MPSLEALVSSEIEVAGVVTNPDRPAGRGMDPQPPPVKLAALRAGLEVFQPQRARDPEVREWLRAREADVATVVAYGRILPADLLSVPPLGFVNVHFSLLPAYRGAAPVQRAVMDGRSETGVSIMVLTEGMDEGPILAAEKVSIDEDETAGELGERLAATGAGLLVRTLAAFGAGRVAPVEQDHAAATYAAKITSDEARIDWTEPAGKIKDHVRGLNPAPGAWTTFRGKRVKVHRVRPLEGPKLPPGDIDASGDLLVGTGDSVVSIVEVQMEGKRTMEGAELARGLRLSPGDRFN